MIPTRIGAQSLWYSGEFFAKTKFQLPEGRSKLNRLTPEQLQDGFERLQALQSADTDWTVARAHLAHAPPPQVAGYDLGELFTAFAGLSRALDRKANPLALTDTALDSIRAGKATGARARTLQSNALLDVVRLFDAPADRALQDWARAELAQRHGDAAAEITGRSIKPQLLPAEDHQRRAADLEALVRLAVQGRAELSPELLNRCVVELGRYGRAKDLPVLAEAESYGKKVGDIALASTAQDAANRLRRLEHVRVAFFQLEGGANKAGGVRAYFNTLLPQLAALGHEPEGYLPLTGDLDVEAEGLRPVPGSEGQIRDVNGRMVSFRLLAPKDPPTLPDGRPAQLFYIEDDHYFTPRLGLYNDARTRVAFPDERERYSAGSMLMNAAASKVAAIRKLGGGDGLTADSVRRAEETLTPEDVPHVIQYNDSHLAMAYAYLRNNEAFREVAPIGVIHNGGQEYQTWLPPEHVGEVVERMGGPSAGNLEPEEWHNMLELMASHMFLKTVSAGYRDRLLNVPNPEQPRLQARLQEAMHEGRFAALVNAIDLAKFNPTTIAGTDQAAPYGLSDLSGKAACKTAYQAELGLPVDPSAPLIVFGNRIASQKGVGNLLEERGVDALGRPITPLDVAMQKNPNLQLILGGPLEEPELGKQLEGLQQRYPDRVRLSFGFVNNRKLMSAGDVYLMPSNHEPCGITQMEAQALGTGVLYNDVDGLKDTVVPYDSLTGTGTGFRAEQGDADSLTQALLDATRWASQPPEKKAALQRNAMQFAQRFDAALWAKNHEALLREAVNLAELQRAAQGQA